jgi:hypothetical protein
MWTKPISRTAETETIPTIPQNNSRFVFRCTLRGNQASVLADTGCTTNIISSHFVRRHNIPTSVSPNPCALQFGKKEKGSATHIASINLKRRGYSRTIDFLLFDINHDAIIGTPWFESIGLSESVTRLSMKSTEILTGSSNHLPTTTTQTQTSNIYDFSKVTTGNPKPEAFIKEETIPIILDKFRKVFQEPSALPPTRPDEHRINLLNDVKLPPWRPLGQLSTFEVQSLKEKLTDLLDKVFIRHTFIISL